LKKQNVSTGKGSAMSLYRILELHNSASIMKHLYPGWLARVALLDCT